MKIIQTDKEPTTADDFVMLRRGLIDHLNENKLTWEQFSVLCYLILRTNPKNGSLFTSYGALSDEIARFTKNRLNKILLSLKKMKYVYYAEHRGSGKSFYLFINKYRLSNKKYLSFAENEQDRAELLISPQNFKESKNALAKGFSLDDNYYPRRTPNNNNKKENIN